jgi:hypothetical protein
LPAELLYVSYSAVQFSVYRKITEQLDADSDWGKPTKAFVSGALGATVATISTYPLDLLRTRFASQRLQKRVCIGFLHRLIDEGLRIIGTISASDFSVRGPSRVLQGSKHSNCANYTLHVTSPST